MEEGETNARAQTAITAHNLLTLFSLDSLGLHGVSNSSTMTVAFQHYFSFAQLSFVLMGWERWGNVFWPSGCAWEGGIIGVLFDGVAFEHSYLEVLVWLLRGRGREGGTLIPIDFSGGDGRCLAIIAEPHFGQNFELVSIE